MSIPWTLKTHLDREHVHYDVLPHSQMFRATAVALTLHVSEQEMAKVVIVKVKGDLSRRCCGDGESGRSSVYGRFWNSPRSLATEEEISHLFPDCEVAPCRPRHSMGFGVYRRSLTGEKLSLKGHTQRRSACATGISRIGVSRGR